MMVRIELGELDREGVVVDLPKPVATALDRTLLVEVRPEPAGWRLLPRGRVGSARCEGLQIDVLPKDSVGLTNVLFLLGYAKDPGFLDIDVTGRGLPDLFPALAQSLLRFTRAALGPGVLQGYRIVEDALPTVRGRIRISDQMSRRPGLPLPIEVSYDEFTHDIPENQILRTALRRMLAVPRLRAETVRSLTHLDGKLDGVTVLRAGDDLPDWRQTRLNTRYQPALKLAELILQSTSVDLGAGAQRMTSFVVNMATVYEGVVAVAVTESLRRYRGTTSPQYPAALDRADSEGRAESRMWIDVVHQVDGASALVFDAKYIAASSSNRYPNANHYQMLAYCTALAVPVGWLVYAGAGQARERRIRNTGITIVEFPIDISAEPARILNRVDELVRQAWHGEVGSGMGGEEVVMGGDIVTGR